MTESGRRKALAGGAAALAFAAIGSWAYLSGQSRIDYETAPVQRGDIEATISATGTPNAVVTVQVGSQLSGNVSALYADFNTHVKKGQLVARIDPSLFQARVDVARANVANARAAAANFQAGISRANADVATAQANVAAAKQRTAQARVAVTDAAGKYQRRVDLFREGIIAAEERDTARTTIDTNQAALEAAQAQERAAVTGVEAAQAQRTAAQTQLAQAQAQIQQNEATLRQAEIDLEHTFIRAPVDGVVVSRTVDVGQTVAAGFQAPTLFQIAQDLTKMQVDTNVDEADIGRVKVGQPADFTVDAYPGRVFHGFVREIRKAPINVQNVVTYDAVIAVNNSDLKLFPGMTSNVKILTDVRRSVLMIPNSALRFRPPQENAKRTVPRTTPGRPAGPAALQTVWVLDSDKKPQPVRVKLGISDAVHTEVASGDLHEGQPVIVAAVSKKQDTTKRGGAAGARKRGPGF